MKPLCPYFEEGCPSLFEPNHTKQYRHKCTCSKRDAEHMQNFVHPCPNGLHCPQKNESKHFDEHHVSVKEAHPPVQEQPTNFQSNNSKLEPNTIQTSQVEKNTFIPKFKVCEIGLPFRVATFNILSDDNLNMAKKLNNTGHVVDDNRFDRTMNIVKSIHADILCLQELDKKNIKPLVERLQTKYQVIECSENISDFNYTCAILLNKDRLEAVNYGVLKTNSTTSTKCYYSLWLEADLRVPATDDTDCNESVQKLFIVSSHLPNPQLDPTESSSFEHSQMLLNKLYSIIVGQDLKGVPVIICGDMGFSPNSVSYNLFKNGSVEKGTLDKDTVKEINKSLSHKFQHGFKSSMMEINNQELDKTINTKHLQQTVDYIWFHSDQLECVGGSMVVTNNQPGPSECYPSHHIPIVAIFDFSAQKLFPELMKTKVKQLTSQLEEKDRKIAELKTSLNSSR
jgi:exonuclease III